MGLLVIFGAVEEDFLFCGAGLEDFGVVFFGGGFPSVEVFDEDGLLAGFDDAVAAVAVVFVFVESDGAEGDAHAVGLFEFGLFGGIAQPRKLLVNFRFTKKFCHNGGGC